MDAVGRQSQCHWCKHHVLWISSFQTLRAFYLRNWAPTHTCWPSFMPCVPVSVQEASSWDKVWQSHPRKPWGVCSLQQQQRASLRSEGRNQLSYTAELTSAGMVAPLGLIPTHRIAPLGWEGAEASANWLVELHLWQQSHHPNMGY